MTSVISIPITTWNQPREAAEQERALQALEQGNVALFPQLAFTLSETERRLLSPAIAATSKNVSLDPATGVLRGSTAAEEDLRLLGGMMQRFAESSAALLHHLLPRYREGLTEGRTSYRPAQIAERTTSWRKDDKRLHIDSFPSSPIQGRRILRVFSNINPHGESRSWRLGEEFEDVARRYLPAMSGPVRGVSEVLGLLGITKGRRSDYDHFMLQLHDRMKSDLDYQSRAVRLEHEFQAGSSWAVFTDQVSHAAMQGQYALEQTFYLPVASMQEPARAPLRVLERLAGRTLI